MSDTSVASVAPVEDPVEDEELAQFQECLTELLALDLPPAEQLLRIKADPRTAPYHDYARDFDLRCIEVAAVLMRYWSARD